MSEDKRPEEEGREEFTSAELPEEAQRLDLTSAEQAEQAQRTELVQELQELGQHLESAFRAALRAIQQRAPSAELEQRARKAAQQVQEAPLVRELESVLVSGLHQINQQLRRVVDRLEARQEESATAQRAESQRLMIEQEQSGQEGRDGAVEPPPGPAQG